MLNIHSIWGLNCVRMFLRRTFRRQTMAYIEKDLLNSTQTCNKHIFDIFRAFSLPHRLAAPAILLSFAKMHFANGRKALCVLFKQLSNNFQEFDSIGYPNIGFSFLVFLYSFFLLWNSNQSSTFYFGQSMRKQKKKPKMFDIQPGHWFTLKSNLVSNASTALDTNVVLSCAVCTEPTQT